MRSLTLPLRRSSTSSTSPCRLEGFEVVVDLLAGQAEECAQHGRGLGLGELGEEPGADGLERHFGGGGVVDDGDVQHGNIITPTTLFVKGRNIVG